MNELLEKVYYDYLDSENEEKPFLTVGEARKRIDNTVEQFCSDALEQFFIAGFRYCAQLMNEGKINFLLNDNGKIDFFPNDEEGGVDR